MKKSLRKNDIQNDNRIDDVLTKSRLVNAQTVKVDEQFKADLKEKLYQTHVNNLSGNKDMDKDSKVGSASKSSSALGNLKKGLLWLGGLSLLSLAVYFVGSNFYSDNTTIAPAELKAVVTYVDGKVEIKTEETDWALASESDVIEQGDSVRTAVDAKAILQLDNGSVVRVNGDSEIALTSMDPHKVVITQVSGESYHRVVASENSTHTVISDDVSAKALGTAYSVKKSGENVIVSVYESKVLVAQGENSQEVDALKKASATPEEIKVTSLTEEEYKNEFTQWNQEADKEEGFISNDTTAPTLTISSPKNGSTTENAFVNVTGTVSDEGALKKIKVNGTIYAEMDSDGFGFNPETGAFKVKVTLSEGKNEIKVVAYDIYWNSKSAAVTVTREVEEEETTPVVTKSFYISSLTSPADEKVSINWYMSGYSAPYGFKVVWSTGANPVYPGSNYKYYSSSSTRSASFSVNPGTYYFRVCIYNGNGACTYYTANKTVTVDQASSSDFATSINLYTITGPTLSSLSANNVQVVVAPEVTSGTYYAKFGWSIVGGNAPQGYKLVWSENSGPTYPCRAGDSYIYYGSESTTKGTITGLESGKTYYVRVGVYNSGSIVVYSNQLTIAIP